ncbi:MAG: ATP-dependent Clp protease ATP-binding subunit ClpX, partial [Lachnospiraceae bacterium]|nr:ATP-dependent Clp protease ATP-binding subunit ClpX [Lachnospiraceae bacterium]
MLDNNFDNHEEIEIVNMTEDESHTGDEKVEDRKESEDEYEEKESEYEDVCFICRRPESKTGKMFKLPNHISVCSDCMHKTMDTVSQFDYQGMLNNTNLNFDKDNPREGKKRFPNISFVNIADLQGDSGIQNRKKLKKKK